MILKYMQFPQVGICDRPMMYFRQNANVVIKMEEKKLIFDKGGIITTNTYFNSFSIGKWKKYTSIENISLTLKFKGSFLITLYSASITNNNLFNNNLAEKEINASEPKEITFNFTEYPQNGTLYFKAISLKDDSEIYGGYYGTSDDTPERDIHIAIGICTFMREQDVYRNINLLNNEIIDNINSPMYNKLDIYISDNSQTLDNSVESNYINIFKNKNLGGSGGFTRTLIEILNDNEKDKSYTHVILMDDDILINPQSIVDTFTFLKHLKPDFADAFIGGHMLKKDRQNIQSEAADYWNGVNHRPVKPNYDLENDMLIVRNEIEDAVNFFCWWYCCMPINVVSYDNLPLPFFIKKDDIEYSLRNCTRFITVNGICVWHEAFEYKGSAHLEYYHFRNFCIMNSVHRPQTTRKQLKNEIKRKVIKQALFRYRYRDAELSLLGVQDFLKGIDYFKQIEGEGFNEALMKLNYTKTPIEYVDWNFVYGGFTSRLSYKENRRKRIKRKLTFNGWFLRAKQSLSVPANSPHPGYFYRAKRVLNYEDVSQTAYITQKDWHSFFAIIKMYRKTLKLIDEKFDQVTKEYRERISEVTNIEFWNEYLNKKKQVSVIKAETDSEKRPRNKRQQFSKLIISYLMIFAQHLMFFIPIKKNRIMFYAHNRKGYTCNPKYIMNELLEKYGNKYEIIWVSQYPETCEKREGVQVVKTGSSKYFLSYLRTKVFVTNDCFPVGAAHKKGQIWINVWHGALSYKHIGYDYIAQKSSLAWKIYKLGNRQPDYFISATKAFTIDTSESFRFDKSIFRELGFARNDILISSNTDMIETIKSKIDIPKNCKVVLYAPTFRKGWKNSLYGINFEYITKALKQRFSGEWIVLFRDHSYVTDRKNYSNILNVSDYPDMNELLKITDVLISDYSSCMYDFSLQEKPCFVYAPDINNYINNDRDFAYPVEKWPYPIAGNNDELCDNIINFDNGVYLKNLHEHFMDVKKLDDGHASERVSDLINSVAAKFDSQEK